MSQHQTTVSERNRIVDLKLQGHTLHAIAEQTGWSQGCVRKWWRAYRQGGRSALDPPDGRQQRGGRMSTFSKEVRETFLAVKDWQLNKSYTSTA